MCGIVGFSNFDLNKQKSLSILKRMSKKIKHRGENDQGIFCCKKTFLAHRRLSIIDIASGHQPMSFCFKGTTFSIVYNGEIYNTKKLAKILARNNIFLKTACDTEIVLKLFAIYKEKCVKLLNGIFAFCIFDEANNKLFLARDQIGVKPLFYYYNKNKFCFASEIKALFEMPSIKPVVNISGLRELFGIAPARTPGKTVYENIYEVKPSQYLIFENGKLTKKTYYKLKSKPHKQNAEETAKTIKARFSKIIKQQLVSDVNIGMFLSGGIDSSIITAMSCKFIKERLKTFSVDYKNSKQNFMPSRFTPTQDNYFINLMVKKYNVNHSYKILNSKNLFSSLRQALIARDVPAMADIDSSLLLFTKEVKKDVTVCLSGEFADEIFCGYPWFYLEESKAAKTFPWAINLELRENTAAENLRKKLDLQNFVEKNYKKALKKAPISQFDDLEDKNMKIFSYLTMSYFGLNLLERTDRTSMQNGMEVRVPFTDYKFVEYVYNIPWKMKNYGGQEKGILRKAFADALPKEIFERKKSPYPKSHDPIYSKLVEEEIKKLLSDKQNKVWKIVDHEYVSQVLKSDGDTHPWFGQLMNKPQYLAFIIQIAMWIEIYKVKFKGV